MLLLLFIYRSLSLLFFIFLVLYFTIKLIFFFLLLKILFLFQYLKNIFVSSFKSALHNVAISIHTMRVTQIQQKIFYSADESLVSELNSYIQVYSVIQSVVIFLVGLIQVIFIKFLFKSSSSSSSSSPSAATYNYYGKN